MLALIIIGIIFLFFVLLKFGFILEFFSMIAVVLLSGVAVGLGLLIFGGKFGLGFHIGQYIGVALYTYYCVLRIIKSDITVTLYENGNIEEESTFWTGVVGIIIVLITIVFIALNGSW